MVEASPGPHKGTNYKTDIFEALQLLKSAYQNGHVAATTQAAFHTEDFIRLLDNSDEDDNSA